ncbi:kinase-like domain-containing protein [Aspergillus varians]
MEATDEICNYFSGRLSRFRVRNHQNQPFYPKGTARDVFRMNEDRLHELFRSLPRPGISSNRTLSDLVDRIVQSHSTILAIVLRIRPAGDIDILRRFTNLIIQDDTFHEPPKLIDDKLPISLSDSQSLFPSLGTEFFDNQFPFCAITLGRAGRFDYLGFRSQCPLPYKSQEKIGAGGFGQVYKVMIKEGHIRSTVEGIGDLKPRLVARKDFKSEQWFSKELDALKGILERPERHDHLVMAVAILQYHDTYSLFFPLADTDLKQYLDGKYLAEQPAPTTMKEKSRLFNRGIALAGALAFLHQGFDGVVFLHLDLKPNNVLVYNAYHPEKEIWKIADFGQARVKNEEHSTLAPGFEGTYLAPEFITSGGMVTTHSDVWSLGCILSLVITYMVKGSRGVIEFADTRGKQPEGSHFYVKNRNSTSPEISPAVTFWFDQLKWSVARNERLSRVIPESLDYLQREVLRPVRRERASAKNVQLALKKIHLHFEQQAPLSPQERRAPSSLQEQSGNVTILKRLFSRRVRHQRPESSVSRVEKFRYGLGKDGLGFRFSPLLGDYLAFFSPQTTSVWIVSEIMSALHNGSQIPHPQTLQVADGAIKSFAVSATSICNCLHGESFQCYIYTTKESSSSVLLNDGVKVSYDHIGCIKRVTMSKDGNLAAFVIKERPRSPESKCKVYLASTQDLLETAGEGTNDILSRSSRSGSVSESSLMSVTTAANRIRQNVLIGLAEQVRFLDFTPDGNFLVIVIQDGSLGFTIRTWEAHSGKCYPDFSVAIESSDTLRSLFTTCCLFMSGAAEPCLALVSDCRRILHVNLSSRTVHTRRLQVDVDSIFLCDDGHTLVLIGKNNGQRAYLLPLHDLDKSKLIERAKINRVSYVPALDDATVRRNAEGQLKVLIASSSGYFLEMDIED